MPRTKERPWRSLLIALIAGLWCALLASPPAFAQSTQPEDQMYQIAKQLNCPTCAGRNLADCPTDTCTQWKQEIATQLKAGKNETEVLAYFKDRFGNQVLQEPPKEGFLLVMWGVPIGAVFALIVLALVVARRAASPLKIGTTPPKTQASDYETQLEQQIKDAS